MKKSQNIKKKPKPFKHCDSSGDATHDDSNNGHGSNGSAGGWSDLDIGGGDSPPSRKTSGSQQRPLPLTGSHDAVIESLSLRNQLKKLEYGFAFGFCFPHKQCINITKYTYFQTYWKK
jgi:hypothetical protein